jgi:predicted secreted Zn-dependent protease
LHSLGLLHSVFRPDGEVCAVRSLMRHRNNLVEMASQHVQHMQKALTQMNAVPACDLRHHRLSAKLQKSA